MQTKTNITFYSLRDEQSASKSWKKQTKHPAPQTIIAKLYGEMNSVCVTFEATKCNRTFAWIRQIFINHHFTSIDENFSEHSKNVDAWFQLQ